MKQQSVTILCPFCNKEQETNLYPIIDLAAKPTLKLGILTGSLFSATCESCQGQFEVMHEALILNGEAFYAFLLAPDYQGAELDRGEASLGELSGYQLRLVSTLDTLKEKILLFDSGLDDRAIELCKLYLLMQMQDKDVDMLFAEHQVSQGKLMFSVFDQQGVLQESIECEDALYSQLYAKAQSFSLEEQVFTRIDVNWAYGKIANA
ncbi:hypothetical protein SpiGrapes_1212 [Sphaerochaeta pleomorpha str. Grapes]|uniref:CpXC domain-containing protein n=1 Tax=Sphaerochaeta pleomorpha (strain ATCC BAA-1885 / DSM 22778 / Grapes) TaxID=158190 RepID=G8QT62_SPHPG|nr:CpXC domain-containing protein [Sphaerochaeta pleomorpha]AEV29029.1 hypothetical protein SpiGrapes_1212 [Sphaerochaeta pleomorpha str. Grapes]